jgi:hypothetical protein
MWYFVMLQSFAWAYVILSVQVTSKDVQGNPGTIPADAVSVDFQTSIIETARVSRDK